jgi:hypothetical protein
VLFVTFNYDILLERAVTDLTDHQFASVHDYISDCGFSIIKVHGSANWGRVAVVDWEADSSAVWQVTHKLIAESASIEITNEYVVSGDRPIFRDSKNRALVPAIAIPVESKQHFECPESHLRQLSAALPHIRKLLIVGWRGMDGHFVALLKAGLQETVLGHVVCGSSNASTDVVTRLAQAGVAGRLQPLGYSFSQYVVARVGAELFAP